MALRSTGSTTLSLGLLSIPIKLYAATHAERTSFSTLHAECGTRIKQQLVCPVHDRPVERGETTKGFELERGQFVTFSDDELKQLEREQNNVIELCEFVPASSVDPVYLEKSSYLAPDEGGAAGYQLLAAALRRSGTVALGRYEARGQSRLVMLRALDQALVLHQLYFAGEVRSPSELEVAAQAASAADLALAEQLIAAMRSERFEPQRYRDTFSERVCSAASSKAQGRPVVSAPQVRPARIADVREALTQSLEALRARDEASTERVRMQGPKKARPAAERTKNKRAHTGTHD